MIRLVPQPCPLAVCRLASGSPLAPWMLSGSVWSVTGTPDELSVVVDARQVPGGVCHEGPFAAFKVVGPLDFSVTGILSRLTVPLADAGIPVFVVSTYDTDYVLIRTHLASSAIAAWAAAGDIGVE